MIFKIIGIIFLALCVWPAALRAELRADEIALLVNRNSSESAALADYYVKARQIPAGRIIELDLPTTEEMSVDQYERQVVPIVRQFLSEHGLKQQVRCLVSIYGVPLKIAARVNSAQEAEELTNLQAALSDAKQRLLAQVADMEQRAGKEDVSFSPARGESIDAIAKRIDRASQSLIVSYQRMGDADQRQRKMNELTEVVSKLRLPVASNRSDSTTAAATTAPLTVNPLKLAEFRYDASARRELRKIAARDGIVSFARVLEIHIDYLSTADTEAAFDSELALLWWPNYPRGRFMANPANYQFLEARAPPMMLTARLDAPTPQIVRDMIATSLQVEREGLNGRVVVDAGGAIKLDPEKNRQGYWPFEQRLVQLATFLKAKTHLELTFDQKPDLLPPDSEKDVALYTGWYSLSNYVPTCTFAHGAVGYHVASLEMATLHDANNNGWCKRMIENGVVATLGPISEPYLIAFPMPDDFFPLLLTGKLTLVETYWRTTPLASWKMCLVGDPLYTPYRVHPVVEISDLPEHLQAIFHATAPNR